MKKILVVATVVKKHIVQFHVPTLKMFKDMGWEVHVAGRNDYNIPSDCKVPYCDLYHEIAFERFPFHPKNLIAYKQLKKLINNNDFDAVHCHTPVGGVLARIASRKCRKKGTKVFYTAHGFHFYDGAPLTNWLLYYPIEKAMSHLTDVLITLNEEDYSRARGKFKVKAIKFINGVGVDIETMRKLEKETALREKLGLKKDDIVLLSVGELSKRKNHKTILHAISKIKNEKLHYLIVGEGEERSELEKLAKELNIHSNVHFLGYRNDVYSLVKMSDVFCLPSYQEGLPVALMEAMAGGLPIVASRIRGITDLIDEGKGGFLYTPDDCDGFVKGITEIVDSPEKMKSFADYNLEKIKNYDKAIALNQLKEIYGEHISF